MATFGHKVAAARDNTVDIYDSVTGVLRLSLDLTDPFQAMSGSPDGSTLFCAHETPTITAWDMQTGGLIHTFVMKQKAEAIAVSSEGRYLACRLPDKLVEVWEVANKMEGAAMWTSSPVTQVCWLKPEERFVVSTETSVEIRDVVAGTVLHSFAMQHPVDHMAYSKKFNQLVIMANRSYRHRGMRYFLPNQAHDRIIKIIKLETDKPTVSNQILQNLSCFAISQTSEELVCGLSMHGLQLWNISTGLSEHIEHPERAGSVSCLQNGTVVANFRGSGIQLLSLDGRHTGFQQPDISALTVAAFDQDRIVSTFLASRDFIVLREVATMSQLLKIPAKGTHEYSLRGNTILCASHKNLTAMCYVDESDKQMKGSLQSWRFHEEVPRWTVQVDERPRAGRISPAAVRLITLHGTNRLSRVCVWNAKSGELDGRLEDIPWPHDIEFTSDTEFCLQYYNRRVSYSVSPWGLVPRGGTIHPSLPERSRQRRGFDVDPTREWVVSGSKRICWIPQGYIRSRAPMFSSDVHYCWVGPSLVMAGEDGILRKFTFS